jgi:hypothetical protein
MKCYMPAAAGRIWHAGDRADAILLPGSAELGVFGRLRRVLFHPLPRPARKILPGWLLSLIVAGDPTNGRNRQSLAAIIAVDDVGYYRLMGEDEAGTARIELIHAQVASGCQRPPNGGMLCVLPKVEVGRVMSSGKHQEVWFEQCEAARTIKLRYGCKAAFDYAVGEKLMNFAEAACEHPAFAREIPRFVSEVRRMFSADELRVHLERLEREQSEWDAGLAELDENELLPESPDRAAARVRQFAMIKELLNATTLGTS